jgi:hypothetical protein
LPVMIECMTNKNFGLDFRVFFAHNVPRSGNPKFI